MAEDASRALTYAALKLFRFRQFLWLAVLLFEESASSAAASPVPVVDLHVDLSYQFNFKAQDFAASSGQFSIEAMLRGGVSGVVLPLFVPRDASPTGPRLADLERSYQRVSQALAHTQPFASPAPTCAAEPGTVRTFYAFEGAGPLADDPDSLRLWQERGLRIVGLVHTQANELASSSGDAPQKPFGLTERGRVLVRRAFGLGLVVDVSHASDRAVTDILSLANEVAGVVIATHSNARALADHPRNLNDAQLRAIAATGGVIGVNFHGPFLARGRQAHLSDVVKHVQHLRQVAGIEHVAIGSDFEGDIRPPEELRDASRFPALAAALARAGFSAGEVRQIFGGNALRVLCAGRRD
ncbi:MAG TPA: membrane dipeptidase [Polyangiaceae bacterium]|nr:membrane dipeptidase [Polyangiaceae bacterium]